MDRSRQLMGPGPWIHDVVISAEERLARGIQRGLDNDPPHRRSIEPETPSSTGMWRSRRIVAIRGGPRNSGRLLRWDPDQGEGVWHATEETELSC